jgi:hypothetical protein
MINNLVSCTKTWLHLQYSRKHLRQWLVLSWPQLKASPASEIRNTRQISEANIGPVKESQTSNQAQVYDQGVT